MHNRTPVMGTWPLLLFDHTEYHQTGIKFHTVFTDFPPVIRFFGLHVINKRWGDHGSRSTGSRTLQTDQFFQQPEYDVLPASEIPHIAGNLAKALIGSN